MDTLRQLPALVALERIPVPVLAIADDGTLRNGMTPADVALFRRIFEQTRIALPKLGPLATSEVFKFAPADPEKGVWQPVPLGISTPIQLWSAAPASLIIDDALARLALARPVS